MNKTQRHILAEKSRRRDISDYIESIRSMIPLPLAARPTKARVLELAIDYIQQTLRNIGLLHQQQRVLEATARALQDRLNVAQARLDELRPPSETNLHSLRILAVCTLVILGVPRNSFLSGDSSDGAMRTQRLLTGSEETTSGGPLSTFFFGFVALLLLVVVLLFGTLRRRR